MFNKIKEYLRCIRRGYFRTKRIYFKIIDFVLELTGGKVWLAGTILLFLGFSVGFTSSCLLNTMFMIIDVIVHIIRDVFIDIYNMVIDLIMDNITEIASIYLWFWKVMEFIKEIIDNWKK